MCPLEEFDVAVLEALDAVIGANAERETWGAWKLGAYAANEEVYAVAREARVPWDGRRMHSALLRMEGLGLCQRATGFIPETRITTHVGRCWQVTARGDRLLELVQGGTFFAEAMGELDAETVAG